ncbi:N-acetyltransferase [Nocardioides sp.]|uniref:GNAT family N-acetyltransferase n=1 Tax=Nocardioides sp. TaxID=35761 RepID=UPI0026373DDF|nr:GNAT family N-acetyltransferase [Nocardioides sp.]
MPDDEEAHPLAPVTSAEAAGRDRLTGQAASLGPHVVGQRVVVRRVVRGETGPSGGPALTDLLGTCLSWSEGFCVVQPDGRGSQEPVRIALADIVSGKPVPPRPSVRQRVPAREAELRVVRMFPGTQTEPLGEWLLRTDPAPVGRLYKRVNSCLALGAPGLPLAESAATVQQWYAVRDRDPLAQVEAGSDVEAGLLALGWRPLPHGEAELRLGSISRTLRGLRASGGAGDEAVVAPESDEERVLVVVPGSGEPLAEGRAVLDGDWLGLHDLRVRIDQRRRGLARAVMATLLDWGAERGALTAWLHVETDNVAARSLYDGLGLGVHHVVRYLEPPPTS